MNIRAISSCFVLAALPLASCTAGLDDDPLIQDDPGALAEEGDVGSVRQSLRKGSIGAVNGQSDYCASAANPCVSGEGDCDSNAQCTGGAVCIADNGPKFGFGATYDVCAPSHCDNNVIDAGLGETSADCGGPCGTCVADCSGTPGGRSFCVGCKCTSGQGDCDGNTQCTSGLVCAADNGPKFGMPIGHDVCVASHCTNGSLDSGSGETGIDIGGPCGTVGAPTGPRVYFSEYVEGSGGNRALEIFNAGSTATECFIQYYLGSSLTPAFAFALPDLSPGIFTVCHSTAAISNPPCNLYTTLGFNGDDSIELICGSTVHDVIGQVGFDPGIEYGSGLVSLADNTIRRKCSVNVGDSTRSDVFVPGNEWDGFFINDFTGLGSRGCP